MCGTDESWHCGPIGGRVAEFQRHADLLTAIIVNHTKTKRSIMTVLSTDSFDAINVVRGSISFSPGNSTNLQGQAIPSHSKPPVTYSLRVPRAASSRETYTLAPTAHLSER
ncbi:hypothetical protein E4U11_000907 [Claviceps purpurea]|nr:hypothetical protein E4U11_000907 [Claviceps purpurea]